MTLAARLSKDGRTVLCGKPRCGGELAWVLEPVAQWLETTRFVWFPPGWVLQRDGAWALAQRAKRRMIAGDRRRPARSDHGLPLEKGEVRGRRPLNLPVLARCPRCGWLNEIAAVALGVDPMPAPAGSLGYDRRDLVPDSDDMTRWEARPRSWLERDRPLP